MLKGQNVILQNKIDKFNPCMYIYIYILIYFKKKIRGATVESINASVPDHEGNCYANLHARLFPSSSHRSSTQWIEFQTKTLGI